MIVLGVDPGSRACGFGLIHFENNQLDTIDFGCIRPPLKNGSSARYWVIYESLCHLIEKYQVNVLSVESQFMQKNVQSALKLGMAKGCALVAAGRFQLPVFEYTPTKAKLAVVGTGKASKYQVQSMVQHRLKLAKPPTPEDAADALALAICHIQNFKQQELL